MKYSKVFLLFWLMMFELHPAAASDIRRENLKSDPVIDCSALLGAHADMELSLLGLTIPAIDSQVLFDLKEIKEPSVLKTRILQAFPELRFAALDPHAEEIGLYVPAYADLEGFSSPNPHIYFDEPTTTKSVILHEMLHYLIDRAHLRQMSRYRGAAGLNYVDWKRNELVDLVVGLDTALSQKDIDAAWIARLKIEMNRLDEVFVGAGEELEVLVFLLKHREELGLSREDLALQFANAEHELDISFQKVTPILKRLGPLMSNADPAARPEVGLLILNEVQPHLERVMLNLGEIFEFLKAY